MKEDQDAISYLRSLAKRHKQLSDVYTKTADDLESKLKGFSDSIVNKDAPANKKGIQTIIRTKNKGLTFKEAIIKIFSSNTPYTAKQIKDKYTDLIGKEIRYKTFSSQLSELKKKQDIIKMQVIESNKLNNRYIYGLTKWFEGDKLKSEYLKNFKR